MPDPEAWQAFAGVGGVIIFLGGLVFALRRLGILRPAPAAPASPAPAMVEPSLDARVSELEKGISSFRACVAENYVRRDDYVISQSRIIGYLEDHGAILARLEERTSGLGRHLEETHEAGAILTRLEERTR